MINKLLIFFLIPIYTRVLTTYDYGVVSTYLAWVAIITLLVGLSLDSSIRNAYSDLNENLDEYMSSILFLALINFAIISIIVIIFSFLVDFGININLIIMCLVQSYMSFVIFLMSKKYMMLMEYKKRLIITLIPNLLVSIISVIVLKFFIKENMYLGRIIPFVVVYTVIGTIIFIMILKKGKKLIDFKYWSYGVKISVPLIFHGLSVNILSQSDRILITKFAGASETGVYSLVYSLSMTYIIFFTASEAAWIPWFTNKMNENRKNDINTQIKLYTDIMVIIATGMAFLLPEALKILTPVEYWDGINMIPPLILSAFIMFLINIAMNVEYYYKQTQHIAMNTALVGVVNIILNIILIPLFGGIMAAYTTLISYLVSLILHYKKARGIDQEVFDKSTFIMPLLIMVTNSIVVLITIDQTVVRLSIGVIIILFMIVLKYRKYRKIGYLERKLK